MMKKFAVSALLAATFGAAAAAPAGAADPAAPVGFTATATDGTAIVSTDAGSLSVKGDMLEIADATGKVVLGTPLTLRVDDFVFPIAATVSGNTATLTPQVDLQHAAYKPVALPFENQAPWKTEYEREQAAWARLTSTITMGVAVGALVGGLTGAAAGCVIGGVVGATAAAATIVGMFGPFLPAAAVGCLGGIIAVGALGTLAGQLLVTGPAMIGAAIQYFTTINTPLTPAAPAPAK